MGTLLLVAACSWSQTKSEPPPASVAAEATATSPATAASPATPTPPATPVAAGPTLPVTTDPVAIEPGTYRIPNSGWSALDYTVTIPKGWTVVSGQVFQKHGDAPDNTRLHAFRPDTIYADTCAGSQGERLTVGPSVADLAAALVQQR